MSDEETKGRCRPSDLCSNCGAGRALHSLNGCETPSFKTEEGRVEEFFNDVAKIIQEHQNGIITPSERIGFIQRLCMKWVLEDGCTVTPPPGSITLGSACAMGAGDPSLYAGGPLASVLEDIRKRWPKK